jgi:CubicO group peptidase (beta-lactamase class C family)
MLYKRSGVPVVALVVILLVFAGDVKGGVPANPVKPYQYTVPEATNDGWETAHVSGENIDADVLKDLFDRVINETYKNIHSVLLVKNGKLVVEEYFPRQYGEGQEQALKRVTIHGQHSVTKSVNAILIGIAIDQHLIRGVEEKISAFFPEYADIFAESAKDNLRLKHFLSMTALSWDERTYPYTDARNDHARLNLSTDPVRYALARPLVGPPGTTFVYNSGIAITLGEIIYKVSGVRADKFAERYLFAPLGIADYYWWKYPNGTVQTGGGLQLRSRDMAKIGYLFLHRGRWQGKQIVSEEWVKESTKQQVGAGQLPAWAQAQSYGYQWWLGAFRVRDRVVESYSAQGRGGQFIFVFPALQMVAVFTGWNDNKLWSQPVDMLQQYILPAVR